MNFDDKCLVMPKLHSDIYSDVFKIDDSVNHPKHYTQGGVECIDAIKAAMDADEFSGYLQGNILKYIWRFRKKNGVEDLQKARWYLDKLIEERTANNE